MSPDDHKLSSSTTLEVLGALWLKETLVRIEHKLDKTLMTIEELGTALDDLGAQLNKALTEILAEIQGLGTVPQPIVDKLVAAKAVAQQLDDLNPDGPAPSP
jgi:hypothetical protein